MSPPVVFLPGSLCDERLFAHQTSALSGPSQVADLSLDGSIEAMAERVLREAPAQFALAGLSLGGIVAAEVASSAPERVAGLALIDTNLDAPDEAQLNTRHRWADDVREGHFGRVVDEILPSMTVSLAELGPLITAMAAAIGPEGFLNQNDALLNRYDRRPIVSTLTCPTLIACGSEDKLCPPQLHADLAARAPQARLVVVEQAGHLSTIDQPARLTEVIGSWLEMCNNH